MSARDGRTHADAMAEGVADAMAGAAEGAEETGERVEEATGGATGAVEGDSEIAEVAADETGVMAGGSVNEDDPTEGAPGAVDETADATDSVVVESEREPASAPDDAPETEPVLGATPDDAPETEPVLGATPEDAPETEPALGATPEDASETESVHTPRGKSPEPLVADPALAPDAPADSAISTPELGVLEAELKKERHRSRYLRALRSTIFSLIVVAAVAVIIAMLVLPVLQIQGTSMTETLQDKDIVVALRGSGYETGDVIAFYYNNNILIKRVIAGAGQYVDIAEDGTVYVDNVRLDEPYVSDPSMGDCNITLPYQVPEGKIFVMGDHRSTSLDSRNTALGCISEDMVVGRLLIRAWPITSFGPIS